MLVNINEGDAILTEQLQDIEENSTVKENPAWYKKLLDGMIKVLLVIRNFLISVLKVIALFLFIAMRQEYGLQLKETLKASELEYGIAHTIYAVLVAILKIFAIVFIIIPFLLSKFICSISNNKK